MDENTELRRLYADAVADLRISAFRAAEAQRRARIAVWVAGTSFVFSFVAAVLVTIRVIVE